MKLTRLLALCIVCILSCIQCAWSQSQGRTITGKVLSPDGSPMERVTVQIKGANKGAFTGPDGSFKIEVPAKAQILVFSFTGYQTQEVSIATATSLSVKLVADVNSLDNVVVIGYGTRTKKDLTGAVSSLKVTQLENENPASVQDALRGNVPGLNISQVNAASAKGGGDLQIRGRSSINAGTTPLIVVDGVIYPGALSDINPNDINSIDVLKDASSAAVFGAKAASGVVLITTKRGNKPKPTITLNSNVGFGELAKNQPLYDGPGFVAWRTDVLNSINVNHKPYQFNDPSTLPSDITIDQWKAYDNSQGDPVDIWLNRLKMYPVEIANYKAGKQTNWYDMMFQKGLRQDHTVSVGSRKEDFAYYLSMNYTNNQGVIVGDNYNIYRLRANLEGKIAKYLTVGLNAQFADRDESQVPVNWGQMVNASPWGEKYKADGTTLRDSPNDDVGNNINPFLDYVYTNRLQKTTTLFGSLYAKGNLPFGFSYQVNFTPNFEFYRYFNGISSKNFQYAARGGIATRTTQNTYNWQVDNLIKWNKTFGNHAFDVTFLFNAEKFQSWRSQMDNEGFAPNDNLSYHNIGSGIKPVISSDDQVSTGDAFMSRLNYTFKDKYLVTASFRRDGYSAFGQKNPRADFPSIALGWVFSEEKFAKAKWLNYGKLRASWGINGNRDIGRYNALSNLTTGKYQYIKADGTVVLVSQLYVDRLQNPNLQWEKTTSYDIGLDFSILNNRLGGSIDVYEKQTKNLLILRALPDVSGFSNVWDNLGQVDNKGIELTLNSTNIKSQNFSWRSTATFSLNRNKIVHLYGPVDVVDPVTGKVTGQEERDDIANRWFIGHDIDAVWDLKTLGIWQQNEADEAAKYGVKPGDFKVQDVNGDGKYSDADRQFLGYRNPRFQWSLRNEFSYKNFDFSFLLYSNWGQQTDYNQAKNNSGFIDRQNSYIFPYWTPENPRNDYARLYSSNGSAGFNVYRKTSFIRLNTVALGYTLPKHLVQKANIESAKVYINVTNAALYSPDWDFWDPEYRNRDSDGNISMAIPPRYYSIGLNVTF